MNKERKYTRYSSPLGRYCFSSVTTLQDYPLRTSCAGVSDWDRAIYLKHRAMEPSAGAWNAGPHRHTNRRSAGVRRVFPDRGLVIYKTRKTFPGDDLVVTRHRSFVHSWKLSTIWDAVHLMNRNDGAGYFRRLVYDLCYWG